MSTIHIRISDYLKNKLLETADKDELSISSAIRILISEYTDEKIEIGSRKEHYKAIYYGLKGERIA